MKVHFLYILLIAPILITAQIQVNEIFADNGDCCLDGSLETEDFVELINTGDSPVDLAGYYFGDQDGGSIIPSGFPELTTISAGSVLVLWFDKDLEQGPLHVDAKLNNNGENIVGIDLNGETIIDINYGAQSEDVSFGAIPDGLPFSSEWTLSMCPSPGELNQNCPLVEGCTSTNATNYNSSATIEDGSCVFGSIDGIMINEYSAANCDNGGGNCGDYDDWIEIFNNSSDAIDLQGYYLSDKIGNLTKWQFPEELIINPNSHVVIYASGLDPNLGTSSFNTSFKLTQTKGSEYIVITSEEGTVIDYIKLVSHQLNHSVGRNIDGDSDWALFINSTPGAPNQNESSYNNYKATPTMNYQPGVYSGQIDLTISCNDIDAQIYYTLDGSFPSTASNYYGYLDQDGILIADNPVIDINSTTVVRARAISNSSSFLNSFVETNTYFINENHDVPIISISGNEVDELINGEVYLRPIGAFEIFDENGVLIDEAVGEFNKHGNDSWAYDQRGLDYITRDQYGYNYAINDKLFTTKDRESFQRLILKAAANDNYPETFGSPAHIRDSYVHSLSQIGDLRMDERSHESCVLYVNGEYWGVYDYREKVDDLDFLDYYYDQGEGYVDFLKTWGGTWVEFGDNSTEDNWDSLVDFVTGNDMSDPDNYAYVKSVYNTGSLIDYFILNSYVVCMDWLNWNTGWWRGKNPQGDKRKWRYILWDMDATFGHYINYTDIPDTGAGADPCDPETLGDPGGQGHVPILNSLFDNEEFNADYINRYADLSNTIFSCDYMINHLDSLIGIITPEMPRQIERWGGSFEAWQENVDELREYILERCSDEFVEGMEECYDVEALDVTVIIEGDGEVELNSIDLAPENSPWTGVYYSGLPVSMSAIGNGNAFNFYWEVLEGDVALEDPSNPELLFNLTSSVTIIAHFDACLSLETQDIVGPSVVEEGSIWQYTFPSEFTNTSEWSVTGGDILFTSSSENTIAIQWSFGTGQGQIVLSQYNFEGTLECLFFNIDITDSGSTVISENTMTDSGIVVFPNPTNTTLNISTSLEMSKVSLYDVNGRLAYSCDNCSHKQVNDTHTINVSDFSQGIYILKIESGSSQFFKRISVVE